MNKGYFINNPHDKFFKETMSDKSVARDFIENFIPKEVVSRIDVNTLSIEKDSFIDELNESFSDILYKVNIDGKDAYVYLLFEHKSSYESMTPLQLLGYITDIWKLHINQLEEKNKKEDKLPVIIPLMLYHGKKTWDKGTQFSNIIETPPAILKKFIPKFQYLLYDFSDFTDEEIMLNTKLFILILLFFKLANTSLENILKSILPLILELEKKETGMEYIKTVIKYIFSTNDEVSSEEELKEKIAKTGLEGGEFFMSIANKIFAEREKKGIEKGIQLDLIDTLKIQLKEKFNTKLSQDIIKGIENAQRKQLVQIRNNIFKISSLDEVKKILNI